MNDMREAQAGRSDAPDRASNFFENTEQGYQNATDRLGDFANRIDNLSDRAAGHQPTTESEGKAQLAEQPASYFDRCNMAEKHQALMMNRLNDSLTRLENLGLF